MARRREDEDEDEDEALESVERVFEGRAVPGWREQVTLRALAVSALLGAMFSVIVMKLNLTTGIIPSLNVSAGLLGFFLLTSWTKLLDKAGVASVRPFTRQENTVVQTCVVACSGIAFSGTTHPARSTASPSSSIPINCFDRYPSDRSITMKMTKLHRMALRLGSLALHFIMGRPYRVFWTFSSSFRPS